MATAATSDIGRGELVGRAGKIDPGANFGGNSRAGQKVIQCGGKNAGLAGQGGVGE